jgi:hypothetical protein
MRLLLTRPSAYSPTGDIPESAIKKTKVKEKLGKREKASMIEGAESEDDETEIKAEDNDS